MRAYVGLINITVVLIIFPVILQTVINAIMLSVGGQGDKFGQSIIKKIQYNTIHNTKIQSFLVIF